MTPIELLIVGVAIIILLVNIAFAIRGGYMLGKSIGYHEGYSDAMKEMQ